MPEANVALSATTGEPLTLVEALAMEGEEGKMWCKAANREWDNLAAHHVYDWIEPRNESVGPKGYVNISATFSAPGMCCTLMSPSSTCSQSQ